MLKLNNMAEAKEEVKQPIRMQTNIWGELTSFKTENIGHIIGSRKGFESHFQKFQRLMKEAPLPYNKRLLKDPAFRDFYQ